MNLNFNEFAEFPKMARLSRECIITEKIDGTNAQICITDDGQMLVGSRTRWITPGQDNYGFAAWAYAHRDELMTLGVGRHFGEWCLAGTQPAIIPSADTRIQKPQEVLPPCCGLVPVLYRGPFDTAACEAVLNQLRVCGSVAAPGFMNPEGIVCYHVAAGVGFKKTIEKDEVPKSLA
jgi:hypothetical protein